MDKLRKFLLTGALCSLMMASAHADQRAKTETIYAVGGVVKAPVMIKRCEPVFPESLRGRKLKQPFFVYEAVISARGEVRSVKLVNGRSDGPYASIDRAFRKAILCAKFRPATRHGIAVACKFNLTSTLEVR